MRWRDSIESREGGGVVGELCDGWECRCGEVFMVWWFGGTVSAADVVTLGLGR